MRYYFLIFWSAFLFSCKKDNNTSISFYMESGLSTSSSVDSVNGRAASFTAFRCYISNVRLVTSANDTVSLSDYYLYEYSPGSVATVAEIDGPGFLITKILLSVGLDKTLNNSNPVSFPAGHPLSLDKDMYWGMLKYRFIVSEGAIDSTEAKNGTVNFPFSIHLGTDTLYRELSFPVSIPGNTDVFIKADPTKMFSGPEGILDMRDYYSNHSSPLEIPDAIKLMNNFAAGISIRTQSKPLPD
jgi:hypothetical protein